MYTYNDIKKLQAENSRISKLSGIQDTEASGWVAPESWNKFATANAPKPEANLVDKTDILDSIYNSVIEFGKGAAKSATWLSDIGQKLMSPAQAFGESIKVDPSKILSGMLTGHGISDGLKVNQSDFLDNLTKDVAAKTNFEKMTDSSLTKPNGEIDWDVARQAIGAGMEAPLYVYGGGKGLQGLMSTGSWGEKVIANGMLGGETAGLQGLISTFKEKGSKANAWEYATNAIKSGFSGAVISAALTGALALPGAILRVATARTNLIKLGLSEDIAKALKGKEATELYSTVSKLAEKQTSSKLNKIAKNIIDSRPVSNVSSVAEKPVINELATKIKKAYSKLPEISQERSTITSKRMVAGEARAKELGTATERAAARKSALSGKMNLTKEIEPLKMSKETVEGIKQIIEENTSYTDGVHANEALDDLLRGVIPQESRLQALSDAINYDLVEVIHPSTGMKLVGKGINAAADFARAVMSSGDVSMIGRQAFPALSQELLTHPLKTLNLIKNSLKYITDDKYYQESMAKIASDPLFQFFKDSGVDFTSIGGNIAKNREQGFASNIAERFALTSWFVKPSERQAVGFLNDIRMVQAKRMYDAFITQGLNPQKLSLAELNAYRESINASRTGISKMFKALEPLTKEEYKSINHVDAFRAAAKLVNASTGRGEAPALLKNVSKTLDNAMFSSKLFYRNIRYLNPANYVSGNIPSIVKKQQLEQLTSMIVLATTFLTMAKAAGADVELNPVSSKFAKAKFGNTYIDLTGGFQPYLRTFAQLATGKVKSTSGNISTMDTGYGSQSWVGTAGNFMRGKLNPLYSTGLDLISGTNAVGEPVTIPKVVKDNIAPLAWRDAYDAIMASEDKDIFNVFGYGASSAVGFGMTTNDSETDTESKQAEKDYVNSIKTQEGMLGKDYLKYKLTGLK